MIRVDVETIIMAAGPVPSVVVLRERNASTTGSEAPLRALSIQTGSFEAAAISQGINSTNPNRPITHDLMLDMVRKLDAKVERVEINRVDAPVFYASVVLGRDGDDESTAAGEVALDARPSDALALAVRANAPIYVEDDVMNRAGSISFSPTQDNDESEIERFDQFVQTLSPDDF